MQGRAPTGGGKTGIGGTIVRIQKIGNWEEWTISGVFQEEFAAAA
jgi:hypothetical protein